MTYTAAEIVKELSYELMMRKRVYTRQVEAGQMTPEGARRRSGMIKQVLDRYELEANEASKPANDPLEEMDLFGD